MKTTVSPQGGEPNLQETLRCGETEMIEERRWPMCTSQLGSPMSPLTYPSSSFQSRAISRGIDTTAKFTGTGTGTAKSKWLALGLGLGMCLGASSLVMLETLPWKNSSSPRLFWALPSGEQGSLLPDGGLYHPLCHVKEPALLSQFFPPYLICPVYSFHPTFPGSLRKVEEQQIKKMKVANLYPTRESATAPYEL